MPANLLEAAPAAERSSPPAPHARFLSNTKAQDPESPYELPIEWTCSTDRLWWLVHTKPRNEKALSRDLKALNVLHFLPLVKSVKRYGGRVVETELPLFPGYLFLLGGENHRYTTLTTHRAAQVISVPDQKSICEELRNVYRMTTSDVPIDLYPGIQKGRRCRVVRGSLLGLEGVVIRRRDVCRVYVAVEILGQSAEVEIDPSLLEVID